MNKLRLERSTPDITSHTYNAAKAAEVFTVIPSFAKEMQITFWHGCRQGATKMLELTRKQQHLAHTIMRKRFPGRQTRVFGSRAHGKAKPWSDLDLVILGQEPVSDLAMAEARADFEKSDLPFRVDLALWKDLPRPMQKQIEQRGQPL